MATLSSHLLNGVDGTHAGGVVVSLIHLPSGQVLFATETDSGGRLQESVDLSGMNPDDRYELVFATGDYWQGNELAEPPRVAEIVLRFTMQADEERYHHPLIISPHSYSTWVSGS